MSWSFVRIPLVLLALLAAVPPDDAAARAIGEPQSVPHLNARGRNAYREYLQAEMHRAFVIAPGGTWAWKAGLDTPEEARSAALEECTASSEQTCVVYAVNDDLVFNEKQWVSLWGPYLNAAEVQLSQSSFERQKIKWVSVAQSVLPKSPGH